MRLRARAPDDPWVALAHGWALIAWERFDEAAEPLRVAGAGFVRARHRLGILQTRLAYLTIAQRTQARQDLDLLFDALAVDFAREGDPLGAARAHLEQARQLNALGRGAEATALLDAIGPALEDSPRDAGRVLRARAVSAILSGDYGQALTLLEAAISRFDAAQLTIEVARCWLEQAGLALYQERLDEALRLSQRAGEVFDAADLPLQRAFALRSSGMTWARLGRYDLAARQTLAARELFRAVGRAHDAAICTKNLGNIFFYTGRWEAALAAYSMAEEHARVAGLVSESLWAARNRAMVYRALGRRAEAHDLLDAVALLAVELGYKSELAEIWHIQGTLLADEGRLEEAAERLARAEMAFLHQGNRAAAAESRLERAWLALAVGDAATAEAHMRLAGEALEGRPHHAWRAAYASGQIAALRGDLPAALRAMLTACRLVAALRGTLASETASSGLYRQAARLHAEALRLASTLGDHHAVLSLLEGQRALTLRRLFSATAAQGAAPLAPLPNQIEALLSDGRAADARLLDDALERLSEALLVERQLALVAEPGALLPDGPFDHDQAVAVLRDRFGSDWTALVYGVAGTTLTTVVLTPEHITAVAAPFDPELHDLLARTTSPAYRRYTYGDVAYELGRTTVAWAPLRGLASRLLPEAVRARLHPGHRLILVPAGALHAVPWAALRLDGAWLAERAVVQILPSLTLAPLLAQRQPASDLALLVGCASFGGAAPELPSVPEELDAVAARWHGATRQLRDAAATRAALRSAEPYGLLHVASHARQLPARGLAAHVWLGDGPLLLPELLALRLAGALVVLSACEGAAADVLEGEEVLSLSWGLLAAGASGVIASLWPLGDERTPALMAALYDELAHSANRGDPARALAAAQRRYLAGSDSMAGPLNWGGLVLLGAIPCTAEL